MEPMQPPKLKIEVPPVEERAPLTKFLIDEETLRKKEIEPTKWLLPMLLPQPALVGLVGRPGAYKTFFTHWIARRLSQGKPLFDEHEESPEWPSEGYGQEIRTLIIEEEMGEEIVQERINAIIPHKNENVYWMINSGFTLTKNKGGSLEIDEERVDELVDIVTEKDIKLMILDPFVTISGMKDENDNIQASKVMKILLDKFVNNGPRITVIFIHHPSKSSDGDIMRGAGDILGKCYMGFAMDKIKETDEIKVKCIKSRWHWPQAFKMQVRKHKDLSHGWDGIDRIKFVYTGQLEPRGPSKKDELQEKIMKLLKKEIDGLNKVQISRLLNRKTDPKDDKNLKRAMAEMVKNDIIVMDPHTYVYSLK